MERTKGDQKAAEVRKKESAGRERGLGPLAEYFPLIRTRQEVLDEIRKSQSLNSIFQQWETETQAPKACAAVGALPPRASPSLSFCTGPRPHPIPFFPPKEYGKKVTFTRPYIPL